MAKKKTINVQGHELTLLLNQNREEYISLTDMARGFEGDPRDYIRNWLRTGATVQYLGVWEKVHNEHFNVVEFHHIKAELVDNTFLMSVSKWVDRTGAIGIQAKAGRYGGTYAHNEIALQFATWLSPEFHVYLVKEFKRLKEIEAQENRESLEWNVKRIMSKANYRIQTEAVRTHLIPPKLKYTKKEGMFFASEADLINMALFGMTAKQWKAANPTLKGNMRDHASVEQLLVLSNLQSLNASLIEWDSDQVQRLELLNKAAIDQMSVLVSSSSLKALNKTKKLDKGKSF